MTLITEVRLRRILDSRGNPTVEAEVRTENGGFGRGAAPSGASTGEYEAVERPAEEAIAKAREVAVPRLEGQIYAGDQRGVDSALRAADGTESFSEIGANSAVAISMAAAKAAADVLGAPLYQHLGGAFRGRTSRFRSGTSSAAANTRPIRRVSRSSSPRRSERRPWPTRSSRTLLSTPK